MTEMVYTSERLESPMILATDTYKGLTYYVLNLGTHPCAYVDVTGTDLQYKDYNDIDIECHFGLTYSREYLNGVNRKGWFIGWDYAHCDDYVGYKEPFFETMRSKGKRWTTEEIVAECKDVIDQIIEMENDKPVKIGTDTVVDILNEVKRAFYYEFDEIIPSIMADKIDAIAKKHGIDLGKN